MPPFDKFFQIPDLDPAVRTSFQREQLSELTLPLATSLMEGGFVSVVAAKAFDVEPWVIAVISAAPMFGNLSSFFWTRLASGRSKVPMMVTLQLLVLLCVVAIALSPRSHEGSWILLTSVITARILLVGIITVRSVAWSLNYDRALRARATGRLQAITSLTVVLTTSLAGWALDAQPENFRYVYAAGAALGCIGVWIFRGVLVQGEKRHRVLERRGTKEGGRRDSFLKVLRTDKLYARYQLHQFTAGMANMMLEPPLVYLVSKQLAASYVVSIGIVMLIPFTLNLATMPLWARYLDRVHVTEFRARQNAGWVVGVLFMFWGAWTFSLVWLAVGRVITGIVGGGGNLAWQLGHNDFAPRDQLSTYMGIHVTLTGVRGAFAPFLGMALYLGWDAQGYVPGSSGLSAWLFLVSAALGVMAWHGFDKLRKDVRSRPLNR